MLLLLYIYMVNITPQIFISIDKKSANMDFCCSVISAILMPAGAALINCGLLTRPA